MVQFEQKSLLSGANEICCVFLEIVSFVVYLIETSGTIFFVYYVSFLEIMYFLFSSLLIIFQCDYM